MKFVNIDGVDYEVLSVTRNILKCLMNPLRNYILPVWLMKLIMRGSESPLMKESLRRPGGWRAMEIIYENAEPVDFIDSITVRYNPFPMGLRNRKRYVTRKIASLIREFADDDPVVIVGLGSGPGTNVREGILLSGVPKEKIVVYLIDIDDDAFEYGRKKAEECGIGECMHFIKGDAREVRNILPDVTPHIVKMIGIVEYLNDDELTEILKSVYEFMPPGSVLITHNLVDYHNSTPLLKRLVNWSVYERTKDRLVEILEGCGFKREKMELFEEPMKIYTIVTARK